MDEKNSCLVVFLIVLGVLALIFITPFLVMLLWNNVATELFDLPAISFWQAFGLHWLCNLLFGHTITVRGKKD